LGSKGLPAELQIIIDGTDSFILPIFSLFYHRLHIHVKTIDEAADTSIFGCSQRKGSFPETVKSFQLGDHYVSHKHSLLYKDTYLIIWLALFAWIVQDIHHYVTNPGCSTRLSDISVLVDDEIDIRKITTRTTESFEPSDILMSNLKHVEYLW